MKKTAYNSSRPGYWTIRKGGTIRKRLLDDQKRWQDDQKKAAGRSQRRQDDQKKAAGQSEKAAGQARYVEGRLGKLQDEQ